MAAASALRTWAPPLRHTALVLAAAFLLASLPAPASAAGPVDLAWAWQSGESTGCRVWNGQVSDQLQWNLTLAMNGTDTTGQTTPTFIYIDDSNTPARQDGWVFVLVAGPASSSNRTAYDDATSNTMAFGSAAYPPAVDGQTMELALYSASKAPPAEPANITIMVTPRAAAQSHTYRFNVTALTDRSGLSPQVQRNIELCVIVPVPYSYRMGPVSPGPFPISTNGSAVVDLWLLNDGTNTDLYVCSLAVGGAGYPASFEAGVGSQNQTGALPGENRSIQVRVDAPPDAPAGATTSVTVTCNSQGGATNLTGPTVGFQVTLLHSACISPQGPTTQRALPGGTADFNFTVQNRGNINETVLVWLSSGNDSWSVLITPDSWSLTAFGTGSSGSGGFRVHVPPDTPIGTYDYFLQASTGIPGALNCTGTFRVQVLQEYQVSVSQPPPVVALPGDIVQFDVVVTNTGNGLDEFRLGLVQPTGWTVAREPTFPQVILMRGQASSYTVYVTVPSGVNLPAGNYSTAFRATSVYAQDEGIVYSNESNLTVAIAPTCGGSWSLETPSNTDLVAGQDGRSDPALLALHVENTGNAEAVFTLTVDTASDLNISLPTTIPVPPFASAMADVSVAAWITTAMGEATLTVSASLGCSGPLGPDVTVTFTVFRLDAAVNPSVLFWRQDPANPDVPGDGPTVAASGSQEEGFNITLTVEVTNSGNLPIPKGSLHVFFHDTFDCSGSDLQPPPGGCGPSDAIGAWSSDVDLAVGESLNHTMLIQAPSWVCLQTAGCPDQDPNTHRFSLSIGLAGESDTSNDTTSFVLYVLPRLEQPQNAGNDTVSPTGQNGTGQNQTGQNGTGGEEPGESSFLGVAGEEAVLATAALVVVGAVARRRR